MTTLTIQPSANAVHSALRLKGVDPRIGSLRPARTSDSVHLEQIARSISQKQMFTQQLLLTTGLGLQAGAQVPVRLPALLLPGLHVLECVQALGLLPPTYRVYQATEFIAATNGIPLNEAQESATKMECYLRKYIERFHAQVASHVQLRFHQPSTPDSQERMHATIDAIREQTSTSAAVRDALQLLERCEQKHSGVSESSHLYTAANALYSGAVDGYPFAEDLPTDTKVILPIGGHAEKPFFAITSVLSDVNEKRVIPLLTHLGSRPTYYAYPAHGDPLSLDDYDRVLRGRLRDGPLRADITALHADGATPESLADIFPSVQ